MKKSNIKLIAVLMICCLLLCSCSINIDSNNADSNNYKENHDLVAHFLDVGQGDCIFIELPDSQSMLIDAGENMYGKSIISYINSLGYDKVDYLVATHPHADHIGSMAYIVNHIDIGQIYMPKVSTTTKTYENLLEAISDKGLKIKTATAGIAIGDSDAYDIDVFAPVKINSSDLNNCSVVLKITYNKTGFLFTGDAETQELSQITQDLSADVLKVGHHGSRTSGTTEFIESVSPQIAVISVGKDNDYGHPHKSTLENLKKIGAEVYRTDKNKTVTVSSDGKNITVLTNIASMKKDK